MSYYYCSKCCSITQRESNAKKIKSFCTESNQYTFLTKIESDLKIAKTLRKKFLGNKFELDSFSKSQRLFLEMAFEQGAMVTYNLLTNKTNQ